MNTFRFAALHAIGRQPPMVRARAATSLALLMLLGLAGCSGLRFKDEQVNLALPEDWKYRTPIRNTADMRFFMKENIGLLVTQADTPGVYHVLSQPLVPDGFSPREEVIKEGAVYASKITRSASTQGAYLAFAASFSEDQAVDYRIVDVSRVDIPWTHLPDAKIRRAASVPNPEGIKRLWIQSLILSRILTQNYVALSCSASASGPAFQADGKCYNTTGSETSDYAIGAVFVDIDTYVQDYPARAVPPTAPAPPLPPATPAAATPAATPPPVPTPGAPTTDGDPVPPVPRHRLPLLHDRHHLPERHPPNPPPVPGTVLPEPPARHDIDKPLAPP